MSDDGIYNPGANSVSGRQGLRGDLAGASASAFANGAIAPPGYRWDFVTDASRNNERVTDASRNNEPVVALVGA